MSGISEKTDHSDDFSTGKTTPPPVEKSHIGRQGTPPPDSATAKKIESLPPIKTDTIEPEIKFKVKKNVPQNDSKTEEIGISTLKKSTEIEPAPPATVDRTWRIETYQYQQFLLNDRTNVKHAGEEVFKAAQELEHDLQKPLSEFPVLKHMLQHLTTLHLLYDKAADLFLEEKKMDKAFEARKMAANAMVFPSGHPLHHLAEAIKQNSVTKVIWDDFSRKYPEAIFGAFFSGLGSHNLKGGTINVQTRKIIEPGLKTETQTGTEKHIVHLTLTHHTRNKLENSLGTMRDNIEKFNQTLPSALQGAKVTYRRGPMSYYARPRPGTYKHVTEEEKPCYFGGINRQMAANLLLNSEGRYLLRDREGGESGDVILTYAQNGKITHLQLFREPGGYKIAGKSESSLYPDLQSIVPECQPLKNKLLEGFSEDFTYEPPNGIAHIIEFEGIGKVIIPDKTKQNISSEYTALYDDVILEVEAKESKESIIKRAQEMLSVLSCGPVFCLQREEDDQRIKMLTLFHIFYPQEAYEIERNPETFDVSVEKLREMIENIVPKQGDKNTPTMKDLFEDYLDEGGPYTDKIQKIEIYPGEFHWCVTNIADHMRREGAIGFMSGIGQNANTIEESARSLSNILKNGPTSSKKRITSSQIKFGASTEADLRTGGGDQVFVRLVNKKTITAPTDKGYHYPMKGTMQVMYDLEAANQGCYGYYSDQYGSKKPQQYQQRDNMLAFAKKCTSSANEVMIKENIHPKYIRGIAVKSDQEKETVITVLKESGCIGEVISEDKNKGKSVVIRGIPLSKEEYKKAGKDLELAKKEGRLLRIKGQEFVVDDKPILIEDFIHVYSEDKLFKKEWWKNEN